jgi:hypothetical protein
METEQKVHNKHYDGTLVANQFIEYFYQAWTTNIDILNEVIKPYSKLKYKSVNYEGMNFIELLKTFISDGLRFENSFCKKPRQPHSSNTAYNVKEVPTIKP